jgi:hypothetical protein
MCARVAIDLNLFNIIAEANGPITAAGLAAKSKADEQLIGNVNGLEQFISDRFSHT